MAHLLSVFADAPGGGNPLPVVTDADGLSDTDMQAVATQYGHESGFVRSAPDAAHDFDSRFWVPNHEMEMCGHATVGAVWMLDGAGLAVASNLPGRRAGRLSHRRTT